MALYELRKYTYKVGKLAEAIQHYSESGWPAMKKGGFDAKLIGYFTSDVGTMNQLVHLWRFDDDEDRRDHWARLSADEAFSALVPKVRPLLNKTHIQLLLEAPWGPHP